MMQTSIDTIRDSLKPILGKDVVSIIVDMLESYRRYWTLPRNYDKLFEISGTVPKLNSSCNPFLKT